MMLLLLTTTTSAVLHISLVLCLQGTCSGCLHARLPMFEFRGGYDEEGNIRELFKAPIEWSEADTRPKGS